MYLYRSFFVRGICSKLPAVTRADPGQASPTGPPSLSMKTLLVLAVCCGCLCIKASGHLLNFADMIQKASGYTAFDYAAYGCHCGWGGSGRPKDATDWCCHTHDCCYGRVISQKCNPKKNKYLFQVTDGTVTCGGDRCGKLACERDKAAALCFKENRESYEKTYVAYPNFLCKEKRPSC